MKQKSISLFFILVIGYVLWPSYNKETTTLSGNALTVPFELTIGSKLSPEEEREIIAVLNNVFEEIDLIFNDWNPHSEVSKLNQLSANTEVQISPQLLSLMQRIDNIVKESGGVFDPTVGALTKLWKATLKESSLPEVDEWNYAYRSVGWHNIDFAQGVFSKKTSNTQLDLGSIVKGHAVDQIIEQLKTRGFDSALMNWGGEIRALGKHPEGRPWKVAIRNSEPQKSIDLDNQAVATSGNYFQSWTIAIEGKPITFTHIVHPHTGFPLSIKDETPSSTTVVAPNGLSADAWATIELCKTRLP